MKKRRFSIFLYLTILLAVVAGNNLVIAQEKAPEVNTSRHGFWLDMMQDPNVSFYDLQRAFNKYWENRTDYKGNGYKVFKRWEYINETRVLPDGKLQAPDHVMKVFTNYMKEQNATRSASGNWSMVAPLSYPVNNTSQPTGMGRINAIAFHPTDANTIFIGAPSGGIWKTTDHGSSWVNLASNLPTLGVSSILVHPTNPDIIYIGTGDRDSGDAPGIGVYVSTNGGTSWTQINNTMGNVTVGAMLMDPADASIIFAATSGGVYKTTNGGGTWTAVLSPGNFKDIKFKPGDPSVIYAVYVSSGGSRFYRSSNSGTNWTWITTGNGVPNAGSRMVIGTTSANPAYVYLVQISATNSTFAALLKSTDSGQNFTTQSTGPNIFGYECDGSGTATQATYDLCITVDPDDVNTLYVGSINNWKSTNGGVNWSIVSHWSNDCTIGISELHADQHVYEWSPLNGNLYVGHDGGISYTSDGGGSWTEISGSLPITQIYKIGQSAGTGNIVLYGQQDNGSNASVGSVITTVRGGDGTECLVDYSSDNYCYNTYVQGDISRSATGPTGSYSNIGSTGTNGIGADESGAWVTPFFLHKTNPAVMFAGYENVFRCDNVKASSASSVTWSAISTGETTTCRVLEQSPADVNVVYAFRSDAATKLKRTDNANATPASVTWSACAMPGSSVITDIKAHPTNPSIVYATAGAYIYKSTDKGITWTDMDPNADLPNLTINCLVYDKNSDEGIYVGNETGVWYKDAAMANWMLFSVGLPPVDVRELEVFYDPVGTQNRLKAATYGRGLWQSDLYESGVLNPTSFTASVINNDKIDLSWALTSGNNVILAYSTSPTFGAPVNGTSYTASSIIAGGGTVLFNGNSTQFNHTGLSANTTYYYKIWSYDGGTIYSTGTTANATTTLSIAGFNTDVTLGCAGSLIVNFTDASVYAYNSWAWDIDNNGTTDYTTQNPTHTFNSPGLYPVKLTINNGITSITKENLILVMSSEPTANTGCTLVSNSNSGNGYGIGIYRFAIGSIDHTTSNNDGFYQNYVCDQWTFLELNNTYNITIRTGTANAEGARVYIDYNDNGIFEAGESVVTFPSNNTGTRTLSFTTPSTGVLLDKGLRLRVLSEYNFTPSAACDISTYGQAEDYTVYFINDATWEGDVSANWHTPGNWSYNTVPGSGINAVIPSVVPNYPVLSNDATCWNLTIQSGASLGIDPGKALTVNGNLTNYAGTSGLVINSDATGTGSLIHSTSGVPATVERYIAASDWINWDDGWHLLSSPVASQAISAFTVVPADEYDFYAWGEPTFEWLNFKAGNFSTFNGGTNFIPGRGYLTAYKTSDTKEFAGNLNSADVTIGLTRTGSGDYTGFNLIGNPFASAVTWGTGWTLGNVGGVAYVWDEATKDYISRDAGNPIPAMNGLMVYLGSGASQNLTIPAASRSHNAQSWYKSTEERILIVAHDPAGGAAKENIIRFNPDATEGFDLSFDGYYLQGYAPKFYSVSGGKYFSVNTLPSFQDSLVIPVCFEKTSSESYSIELRETIPGAVIYLMDKKSNTDFNLSQGRVYNFTSVTGDNPDRFEIHFKTVGIDDLLIQNSLNAWYINKRLFITSQAKKTTYGVFELQGRLLLSGQISDKGSHTLPLDLPSGIYVVRLSGDNQVKSMKIVNF